MSPKLIAILLIAALLASCTGLGPGRASPPPTLPPQTPPGQPTTQPAGTTSPNPDTVSTIPPSPTGGQAGSAYPLRHYALTLPYDPAQWAPQDDALASRRVPSCLLREQGPTEIPQPVPVPTSVTLGAVRYDVYAYTTSAPPVAWYLAREGLAGYDKSRGIPILVVTATARDWPACEAEVASLLSALRTAP